MSPTFKVTSSILKMTSDFKLMTSPEWQHERARANEMKVRTEKSKIMANSTTNTSSEITLNGEKLEEVTSFKYSGASMSKDGTSTADQ
ncbi:hypothetical protein DPMN_005159 [Dreissena polymorpha]|uniref:Uncharacterized protein n=1 Tax=Dreissena polymorpha TaxID=45954 RepID=A0A9D4RTM4_DREPO|nr:hypothetical protein DPMN_005159 [Dreissena polymorpha]